MRKNHYLLINVILIVGLTVFSLKESVNLSHDQIPFLDKVLHLLAYLVLTVFWSIYFSLLKPKYSLLKILTISALLLIFYGIVIEVLQSKLTDTRVYEISDIAANSLGIVIGILIFKYFINHKLKSNKGLFF